MDRRNLSQHQCFVITDAPKCPGTFNPAIATRRHDNPEQHMSLISRHAEGSVKHDIGVDDLGFNEITMRKQAESELEQHQRELAAGVAHAINNPVGFVNSNLNTLRDYQQNLEKLITRHREALNEVRQLPLNGCVGLLSQKIGTVDALEREIGLECYPRQLNQVFMNLLVNAGQAISGKGEIKIQTRRRNSHVEILFSDTGCGIAQEDLNKIFAPFFTTKPVGKGTGPGLHVSCNIIKKHNGDIRVTSEKGEGTVFALQLPIQPFSPFPKNLRAGPRQSTNISSFGTI